MFRSNEYNGIYQELAETFGLEITKNIFNEYRGQQITFPMRLYSKEYVVKYIIDNYDGTNSKNLARKFMYSERWVRTIINKNC